MTRLEVVGMKKLYMSYLEVRHLTWLSLIGPRLEAGTKIRGAVSYSSSPGHLGLIVTELLLSFLDCR